jgi:hypothetical protein
MIALMLGGACLPALGQSLSVEEASGIARQGDSLLVVSDRTPGSYFRIEIPLPTPPAMELAADRLQRALLPGAELAVDLEGIAVLADGRVVVLSERLRSLVGEQGLVAEYDNPLSEFGNRGLEGVAARDIGNAVSEVAVLWEGGYPDIGDVPEQLRTAVGRQTLDPIIWIHELPRQALGMRIRERDARRVRLNAPRPTGSEPDAQRFRAADLIWHTWRHDNQPETGFIVLLLSNNSPHSGQPTYAHTWLQRFRLTGEPFGDPLDVKRVVPNRLADANWEGLGWFEHGRRVILVHDTPPRGTPTAVIVDLPPDW